MQDEETVKGVLVVLPLTGLVTAQYHTGMSMTIPIKRVCFLSPSPLLKVVNQSGEEGRKMIINSHK